MQEQNNNTVQQTIDGMLDTMKSEISAKVTEELASQGVEIVPMDYNCGKEIVKLIDKYQQDIRDIDEKIAYNTATYKESKAKVDNYLLMQEKVDIQNEVVEKLDDTLKKQEMIQQKKIDDIQNSKDYKEAKQKAFSILSLLKDCEIPVSQLMDILSPIVEASDIKSLQIAHTLLQKNPTGAYAIDTAISNINQSLSNTEIRQAISTAKAYVLSGNDNLSFHLLMSRFR